MKKFLQKLGAWFVSFFNGLRNFLSFLNDHVDDAIAIVGNIRNAVESPVFLTVLQLLPETLQSAIGEKREKALSIINVVLQELVQGQACLEKATVIDKLKCFVERLKNEPPAVQEAMYAKFASLYAKHSHGAKLSTRYYDTAVQTRFFQDREKIAIA